MNNLPAKIYKHPHLGKWSIYWVMYIEFKIRLVDLTIENFKRLYGN